ncbi:TetR/AcrR family transcriptional regulator C-terminal domain-containing protein [Streptomyces sp. NPDC054794]
MDHVLVQAMHGYQRQGTWRARLLDLILRSWDAYAALPQLAKDASHYPGTGPGSQLVIEETLQALSDAGVPEELIPEWYHRLVTLSVSLISAHAASQSSSLTEQKRRLETFRVITLGADPADVRNANPGRHRAISRTSSAWSAPVSTPSTRQSWRIVWRET